MARGRNRAALVGAAVTLLTVPAIASAASSPKKLEAAIIAAARTKHAVHYVSTTVSGSTKVVIVADVGPVSGSQHMTISDGASTGHVTVIVSGNAVLVRGDAFGLFVGMGFNPADARADANVWVAIAPSSDLYAPTKADVTFPSLVNDLRLTPPYRAARATTVQGKRVVGVAGTGVEAPVPSVLYGAAGSTPLPVKETLRPSGTSASIVLSRWNEAVHVNAPAASKTLGPVVTA
jgi:hypothetical protein